MHPPSTGREIILLPCLWSGALQEYFNLDRPHLCPISQSVDLRPSLPPSSPKTPKLFKTLSKNLPVCDNGRIKLVTHGVWACVSFVPSEGSCSSRRWWAERAWSWTRRWQAPSPRGGRNNWNSYSTVCVSCSSERRQRAKCNINFSSDDNYSRVDYSNTHGFLFWKNPRCKLNFLCFCFFFSYVEVLIHNLFPNYMFWLPSADRADTLLIIIILYAIHTHACVLYTITLDFIAI